MSSSRSKAFSIRTGRVPERSAWREERKESELRLKSERVTKTNTSSKTSLEIPTSFPRFLIVNIHRPMISYLLEVIEAFMNHWLVNRTTLRPKFLTNFSKSKTKKRRRRSLTTSSSLLLHHQWVQIRFRMGEYQDSSHSQSNQRLNPRQMRIRLTADLSILWSIMMLNALYVVASHRY